MSFGNFITILETKKRDIFNYFWVHQKKKTDEITFFYENHYKIANILRF